MFGAIIAALTIAQDFGGPQRKTTLPNGVGLFVERSTRESGFILHFFVATGGAAEPDGQRGAHHLLEHLLAKGRDKQLDAKLESRGMSLTADTLRDGIRFEIEGPASGLEFAVRSLRDLLKPPVPTQDEISKEAGIIAQEEAVRTPLSRIGAALWQRGFGGGASDPLGSVEEMAKMTPESLTGLYGETFRPSAMSVVVVGDVDLLAANTVLVEVFGALDGKEAQPMAERKAVEQSGEGFVSGTPGSGLGAFVGSFGKQDTLATLAAGFAIATETQGAQVVYTPSPIGGLVTVIHPSRDGLAETDRLIAGDSARLFAVGRATLLRWLDTADRSQREKARLYGQMMGYERFFRLQDVAERATEIRQVDFVNALQKFQSRSCVRVGGVR